MKTNSFPVILVTGLKFQPHDQLKMFKEELAKRDRLIAQLSRYEEKNKKDFITKLSKLRCTDFEDNFRVAKITF